jgi:hypothetical protein
VRVVLDASAIIASSTTLNSPAFRSVLAAANRLGIEICVPEIVIDEVSKYFREDLEKQRLKVSEGIRRYSSLTETEVHESISETMVDEQVKAHRLHIVNWVEKVGGRIIDYPAVTHREIASLDLAQTKPFGGAKGGYRDALIWFSLVELLKTESGRIVFVTNNTRDFVDLDRREGIQLHPDLVDDLKRREYSGQEVECLQSLDELNAKYIIPSLQELDEIALQLQEARYPHLELAKVLSDRFDNLISELDVELEPGAIGYTDDVWYVGFLGSTGYFYVESVSVKRLSDRELLIEAEIEAECEFELQADSHSEIGWELNDDRYDRGSTVTGTITKTISCGLQLTFDSAEHDVTSIKIRRLGNDGLVTEITGIGTVRDRLPQILHKIAYKKLKAMRFD